ncbi:MAG: 16S rRNA pseudouridine(516) synthase [Firmicutes bacterium]|nr:16S rRNA pseudouridine(516) synthase [Bacillota bacterium]
MPTLRLDKLLCDSSALSRSEARIAIRTGRVSVDGAAERRPERKLDPAAHSVTLDGAPLRWAEYVYYLLNKPAGVLTATEDAAQRTVLDLFPAEIRKSGIFPVGRLDKDAAGLLLLTNDGAFAHELMSPRKAVPKIYRALTDPPMAEGDIPAFAEGVILGDGARCAPAKLELLPGTECRITVTEGRYHQVKRMVAARGKRVRSLERIAIGGLRLPDGLDRGAYARLEPGTLMKSVFQSSTSVHA